MLDFAIFAVTFLAVLIIAIIWLYPSSAKVTTIPGLDPTSKEDGNLTDIGRAGSLHAFLQDLHDQFGAISGFWWGRTYVVSIASPALFKAHSHAFDRPSELFQLFKPLITENSIEYANGPEGRKRRSLYDQAFHHEDLRKYYPTFQKMADVVVRKWSKKGPTDHIPLSEDMFNFAVKSTLVCLLGDDFEDDKLASSVNNAHMKAWGEMERKILGISVTDEENTAVHKSFDEAIAYLRKTIKKVMQHRQELKKKDKLLIDVIMENTKDEEAVVADVLTYLMGAFHPTANVLTWALYFLATHKDVQDKVFKEIKKVLEDDKVITDNNYGQLRYTIQVIDETMRCAVITPWAARVQDFDTELEGHKIPKNTPVIQALGVVMQDETIFPLPQKFDPDRFSVEHSKDRSPFAFTPFGFAGKRMCPADKFAHREAAVLLTTVLRKFEISMWEDQVVQPQYGLVTHPVDEIWIKVSKRQ